MSEEQGLSFLLCPTCRAFYTDSHKNLEYHHRKVHGTRVPEKKKKKKDPSPPPEDFYLCNTCGTEWFDSVAFCAHSLACGEQEEEECCCNFDAPTKTRVYETMLETAPPELLAQELDREIEEIHKITQKKKDTF